MIYGYARVSTDAQDLTSQLAQSTRPPTFGRVVAFDDRMMRLAEVLRGAAVRRVVATADVAAGPA